MKKYFFLLLIFIIVVCIHEINAWRHFFRGRKNGFFLGEPSKNILTRKELPKDQWFEQILDHFDPTNGETWKQRYHINKEFHKPGGPVFLMIGGEGEAQPKWMLEGAWIKYANDTNALCFQLEHRFYGKSHPTSDTSTKNLKYLSSEQALADLAYFISAMNEKYRLPYETKWIAFGGSYPGSLAAWLRLKYPHLIHGSISTSGPLLAKVDFTEYFDVVIASLGTYSSKCVTAVQRSFQQIEILLKHMVGQRTLSEQFKLCDPVENSIENNFDISNLFESIAGIFAGVVQYNKDNSPHATVTIDNICDIMMNETLGTPLTRLAEVNKLMLMKNKDECLDYKYDKMIDAMKNISWSSEQAAGGRQWTYQTCTEFGFYQTSNNKSAVFGDRFPVDFFIKQCEDIFTNKFDTTELNKAVIRTNTYYGELHPQTTNVLYVHGSIDPWHALGLTKSNKNDLPTIFIEGTAHCANMYEPKESDFPQLIKARENILEYLKHLIYNVPK